MIKRYEQNSARWHEITESETGKYRLNSDYEKLEAENRHLKGKLKEANYFNEAYTAVLKEKDEEIIRLQTDLKVNLINKDSFEGIQREVYRLRDELAQLKEAALRDIEE